MSFPSNAMRALAELVTAYYKITIIVSRPDFLAYLQ